MTLIPGLATPLIVSVIDFEATGEEGDQTIIEVGWVDVDIEEREIVGMHSELCFAPSVTPETRAIHHISAAELAGAAPFDGDAFIEGLAAAGVVTIAAHSMEFERKFFPPLLPLLCTYKVALRVWPDAPMHSNSCLRYWLADQGLIPELDERAMPPHRALPDAFVTAHILIALLETGVTGRQMVEWQHEPAMLPRCPIGVWRGHKWADVEHSFLTWILSKPDMRTDTAFCARREIERREIERRLDAPVRG